MSSKKPFESRVQNLVYILEVGAGAKILKGFLFGLFIIILSILYMANQYVGFSSPRSMDQAQLARSFAETGTLTTRVIRPASIRLLQEKGKLPPSPAVDGALLRHPDLVNAPLWPVVMGLAFKAAGTDFAPPMSAKHAPENWVILPLNLLFCFLSGLLLYLMGRQLFDPRVAFTALCLFFLTNALWAGAIAGSDLPLTLLLHTFALWCLLKLLRSEEGSAFWKLGVLSALMGASLALAFLSRYAALTALPGFLLVLVMGNKRRGLLPALITLVVFAGVTAPWILRNVAVSGTPFGIAPELALRSDIHDLAARSLETLPGNEELPRQLLARLLLVVENVFSLERTGFGSGLVLCFFVVALFYRFQRAPVRALRWSAVFTYGLVILASGIFGEAQLAVTLILLPLVILYGSAFFHLMLDRLQIGVQIVSLSLVAGFVLVQALPMLAVMMPPRPSSYPPYFAADSGLVARFFKPQELICTDMPWATAWYGGLLSLQMPVTVDEFYEIHDRRQPIRGLFLTQLTRDKRLLSDLSRGPFRSWKKIIELSGLPRGFPTPFFIPLRQEEQLLFADSPRWNQPPPPAP